MSRAGAAVHPEGAAREVAGEAPGQPPGTLWKGLVRTARPKQWTKNLLVLAAPAAAGVLTHRDALLRALAALALFCAVASGTYFLNDALDAEADREHPSKRFRPVAAGVVGVRLAFVVAIVLMAGGIALGAVLRYQLGVVLATYVALQLSYSFYLKHQPVFDMVAVAAGFVLRAIAGAVAIPVKVSEWFLIVATFGSLLMVTGKRLAEHAELGEDRGSHRITLDSYSTTFLWGVVAISAAGASLGYCLWAFDLQTAQLHHHDPIWFQLSIAPVLIALLYFAYLIDRGYGAKPEDLVLRNRPLQILGLAWAVLFALGVYVG
jgi:decaprenyl-phosphate phosphoribosyltransferase